MPNILIVDDDRALLKMVKAFLESQGWTTSYAYDGASGLRLALEGKPDIILLDVNLPDTDGYSICARLKQEPATKNVPIVLMSGERKKAEDILQGLNANKSDAYLIKPVHLAVLKAKLEAVLHAYGTNQG